MDRLTLMQAFVQVAESGSFSAAADAMRSTQSSVSKLVRALEGQLNTTLFTRTTRRITLTEEAQRLLPLAKALIERYDAAIEATTGTRTEPRGHLRLLTSDGLGRMLFLPYVSRFLERFPHITIEHIVTDRKIDLVENNIDLALRMGDLKDSSYKAKRIGLTRRVTVATPAYLKRHGIPKKPEDLMHHNCILFTRLAEYTGTGNAWEYRDPQSKKITSVIISGNYASDNSSTVRQAALSDIGVYQGPSWLFGDDITQGHLKEILSHYEMEPFPIYLIHPAVDYLPQRTKVLMDYLSHEFSLNPWVAG
ncbi:MAG: LysR family transcriptional regulator [Rickettsiales bacterium]|nr:LysR family transcriptional regulator [Rickettsiales bacterium]